jgi:replicative DNA helicase
LKRLAEVARLEPAPVPSLPQNVEAEAALLGALMIDNRIVERIADKLQPEHFFEPLHARIFTAILRETSLNKIANPVTLKPYFDADPGMKEVGGPGYLAQLTGSGAAVIGAYDFALQIVALAQLRQLIQVGRNIAENAADTSEDVDFSVKLAFAEAELATVGQESEEGMIEVSAAEAVDRALKAAENPETARIRCGIDPIDAALGPLAARDLTIVAGRPGMGSPRSARITDAVLRSVATACSCSVTKWARIKSARACSLKCRSTSTARAFRWTWWWRRTRAAIKCVGSWKSATSWTACRSRLSISPAATSPS